MAENASNSKSGMAPADARATQAWPLWGKIAAYVLLAALALAAIWLIDRKVMELNARTDGVRPTSATPAQPR